MKKLNPAQVKVLRALAEEGAVATHYRGSRFQLADYWSIGKMRPRPNTLRVLIQYRLIKATYDEDDYFNYAIITPAGRAYLAELYKEAP